MIKVCDWAYLYED